jgi:hypothetical protein
VYTIFSNKAGHGGKRTIVAVVKGTKAEVVSRILKKIPLAEREKVKEVTMDFSDSMYAIVRECFPNATIIIDCFHIVQRLCEGLDEMRLRFKRLAVTATKKEEAAWKKAEDVKAKKRAYGRTRYAAKRAGKKKPKGKKRGRKRIGKRKFRPSNCTRSSGRPYSLICVIRAMFRNKKLTRDAARGWLHKWYEKVSECTIHLWAVCTLRLHEQHDLYRRLPDNAILHGNQTGCLYGHWYHSFAHLSRTQSVPHRQDGCNSHKCEFLSKKRDVVMLFYRRIVKKAIKCFVISKQIITFAPTK